MLSHLVPTRAAEASTYREAVASLGLRPHAIPSRFEGEADLFPAGDSYLFTFGEIRRQRFAPRAGWPPWKRLYGFRSEPQALVEIGNVRRLDRPVYTLRLTDERYYHGDTCLCSFGPGRASLLAYRPALDAAGTARLDAAFGDRQLALSDRDAEIYAANSFHLELDGECLLIMPEGISERLEDQVRSRGARVLKVDVSEFHKKGGGSVKCMIGDLGELP